MLGELRRICFDYNCYVFYYNDDTGFGNAKGYQIYGYDIDELTSCVKEINNRYYISWISNLISSSDLRGLYYYIEIN